MRLLGLSFLLVLFGCSGVRATASSVPFVLNQSSAMSIQDTIRSGIQIGRIDSDNLDLVIAKIEEKLAAGEKDIPLYFVSPGGSIGDGLVFVRYMEKKQAEGIKFTCTADLAASMGAVIYSGCDFRQALPRATIMVHGASGTVQGKAKEMQEAGALLEHLSKALIHHMASHMTISFEELWKRAGATEYWLTADEAKAIGLVDYVLK
jgi:ATP-dependent Clp protease protease subunit